VLEEFAREFPRQYINAGVAEQNMTGMAIGLALEGKIVYTYSIGNFPSLRCLEQIRNDACYHDANIKIISVGGGFAYGALGFSHHATEDLGIMRTMPHMTVVAPGDPLETRTAVWGVHHTPGPCYLRLGRGGEPVVHGTAMEFRIGKAIRMYEGSDAILISTGGILGNVYEARNMLSRSGLRVDPKPPRSRTATPAGLDTPD
jgi:transketolase